MIHQPQQRFHIGRSAMEYFTIRCLLISVLYRLTIHSVRFLSFVDDYEICVILSIASSILLKSIFVDSSMPPCCHASAFLRLGNIACKSFSGHKKESWGSECFVTKDTKGRPRGKREERNIGKGETKRAFLRHKEKRQLLAGATLPPFHATVPVLLAISPFSFFFSSFLLLSFFFRPMVTFFLRRKVLSYFIFDFISTYHSCMRKNNGHWETSRNRCEISLESWCFKKFFGIYGEYRLKDAFGRTSDFREMYQEHALIRA